MKHFILLVATLLVSVNVYAGTSEKEYCSRGVVCLIEEIESGSEVVRYSARNRKGFAVTLTLRMKELTNMESNVPLPYTVTLGPYQTKKLATLIINDPGSQWRWHSEYNWRPGPVGAEHSGYIYSLPYAPGEAFKVTKGFNEPESHLGNNKYSVDWAMPEGTPVYAARGGVVGDIIEEFSENGGRELADKANFVAVLHDDGTVAYYYHLEQYGVDVKIGQVVEKGTLLGWAGNTGYSTGPHLHFSVCKVLDGFTSTSVPVKFSGGAEKWFVPQVGHTYRNGADHPSREAVTETVAPNGAKNNIRLFWRACISDETGKRACLE